MIDRRVAKRIHLNVRNTNGQRRHWNYRLIEYADNDGFGLHEVHYIDGEIDSWTEKPIIVGMSVESIYEQLLIMRTDVRHRPVLDEKELLTLVTDDRNAEEPR